MGLFSRKKSEQNTRSASRSATSSEAQAAELRGRARRRLIGALVLVLTAIIVVPMMFDDTTTQQQDTPVVLPSIVPPVPEPELAAVTQSDYSVDSPVLTDDAVPDSQTSGAITLPDEPQQPEPEISPSTASAAEAEPVEPKPAAQTQEKPPQAKPEPATEKPSQPSAAASDTRTDDGSVALALLEGRVPASTPSSSASSAQQQGSFILQIAAYSTEADAEKRRSSLISSGVTNAYVERAMSNNKATYRLRVGSFPTRDAAQAAQARLRALGYDNSMLLSQ